MLSKNTLFEFLYQNLHDQITCGHLKPGDTLPSMPQLAAIYNVGIRTVKDVLARLKTEGLIQTTERKPARVIYRAEKNSASQSYAVGLLRRQESLTEVYQTMGLILPSIFHFSAAHCDIKKLPSYQKLLKKNNCQDTAALDAAFSALLNELLRSSNNLLYNDLYNSLKTYSKVTLAAPKNSCLSMIRKPSGCCWLLYRVMITSLSISVSMICISAFCFSQQIYPESIQKIPTGRDSRTCL